MVQLDTQAGTPSTLEVLSENRCFGGRQMRLRHRSAVLDCLMVFSVFLPPNAPATADTGNKLPTLYWLSGLTCNDQNFVTKAGAQQHAAKHGLILVAPDTSPRSDASAGLVVADDPTYDLGQGAGFYVDATRAPWAAHFQMYSYISAELPDLIEANFPVDPKRCGIFGHSMGGHGALVIALRNQARFRSVSAFSPICAPSQSPWGERAFGSYLGEDRQTWAAYDACALLAHTQMQMPTPILIDQGEGDEFLSGQLKPELLEAACARSGQALTLRRQAGYDHSYYFIASFIEDHIEFHAKVLRHE